MNFKQAIQVTIFACCFLSYRILSSFLNQYSTTLSLSQLQPSPTIKPPTKSSTTPKPVINNTPKSFQQITLLFDNREEVYKRIKPKTVALTFDDGPDIYTEKILNAFLEHNKKHNLSNKRAAKATFFVIGKRITNYTCRVIERIYKEGHEIGNHTYSHLRFNQISPQRQREEISEAEKAIKKCNSYIQVRWFRPPYGLYDISTINLIKEKKLHIALWTIDTNDWRKSVSFGAIIQSVINTSGQDVVLMHDGREINMDKPHEDLSLVRDNTVNALPTILERLSQKNIEITTLSEAFGLSQ